MRLRKTAKIRALASARSRITVFSSPGDRSRGLLCCGPLRLPCALGRSGVTHGKREGDGATPAGRHRLAALRVRRDRLPGPRSRLPARVIRRDDGWCDDAGDGRYNRPIRLPDRAGHERMWRDDGLYDIVGILGWNLRPRIRGRGSAIFLHLARPDPARPGLAPTAGCIALRRDDLKRLLLAVGARAVVVIGAKPSKERSPCR